MKNVKLVGFKSGRQLDPFSENYREGSWLYITFDSSDVFGEETKRVWVDHQRYIPDERHIGCTFLMYKPNKHVCKFEMVNTTKGGEK